jgi:hypothetical protein
MVMNKFFLSLITILSLAFSSLGQKIKKTYLFKIDKIENIGQAKEFTEATRGLFDCIPNFNDKNDSFYYSSNSTFFEKEINEKLNQFGYILLYFKEDVRD